MIYLRNSISLAFWFIAKFQFQNSENFEMKHMTSNAMETAHVKNSLDKISLIQPIISHNSHFFCANTEYFHFEHTIFIILTVIYWNFQTNLSQNSHSGVYQLLAIMRSAVWIQPCLYEWQNLHGWLIMCEYVITNTTKRSSGMFIPMEAMEWNGRNVYIPLEMKMLYVVQCTQFFSCLCDLLKCIFVFPIEQMKKMPKLA